MEILKGSGVSGGIAIGDAYIYLPVHLEAEQALFPAGEEPVQLHRWEKAKADAHCELEAIAAAMLASDPERAKIFSAQCAILDDEEIDDMVRQAIAQERAAPEWAVQRSFSEFAELLARSKNPLIAQRASDLMDVSGRIVHILRGIKRSDLSALPGPVVIVAHDLLPSDTATLDRKNVLGIVTETGVATSHSAIIAKGYRIPAVLGVQGALDRIEDGQTLILDGDSGKVTVAPDAQEQDEYAKKKRLSDRDRDETEGFVGRPGSLADGQRVLIGINIGYEKHTEGFASSDFVGLFRTEFLYMNSDHLPTEEEQFTAYKTVLQNMGGKPVTMRTLDIGGDKTLPYMELPREANPFLGKRAVRLCFERTDIFRTQLRAALRASPYGKMQIMFPMIGSIDDIRRAKEFTASVMAELETQGIDYDREIKLGIMIEIPSIAMIAELAAGEVDFASIGTNDLCQYLCAADRMEPGVREYYQSYSPAFLRTLRYIIGAFNSAGKEISMCGELAGDPKAAALLAGMGLRKFSMAPSSMGGVKRALSAVTEKQAEELCSSALSAATQDEVLKLLEKN